MYRANARKKGNKTYLSKGQRGKGIFGDLKKMGERLNKKYAGLAKITGVDKAGKKAIKKSLPSIESKLAKAGVSSKVIKPLSKEINKQLGKGIMKYDKENKVGEGYLKKMNSEDSDNYNEKKYGFGVSVGTGWFDDMISTLAVLPIPGVSCIARTVAVVKTAVDTATSDHPAKAFGGVIGDLADTVDKIAPPFVKEITAPGKEYVKAIGFGAISPQDTTKMLKVGMEHLDSLMNNIIVDKLPSQKAKQIMTARHKIKSVLPEIKKLKTGGSFVSSTLSGLIGNISREGLRK